MAVVNLRIDEPAHNSDRFGPAATHLLGTVLSSGHPPLTFKWYSSLVPPPGGSTDASIPGSNSLDFTIPSPGLPVGSQVITFSAKDVAADTPAALAAVQNAGMAGGPVAPANPAPCVIHVYIATILLPGSGATLSKASATLRATAPRRWNEAEYQQLAAQHAAVQVEIHSIGLAAAKLCGPRSDARATRVRCERANGHL
jgi:hypothetical protein